MRRVTAPADAPAAELMKRLLPPTAVRALSGAAPGAGGPADLPGLEAERVRGGAST